MMEYTYTDLYEPDVYRNMMETLKDMISNRNSTIHDLSQNITGIHHQRLELENRLWNLKKAYFKNCPLDAVQHALATPADIMDAYDG